MNKKNKKAVEFFKIELDIDIPKTYERLKKFAKMSIKDLKSRDAMLDALNSQADREHDARRIAIKAKRLYDEHMIEYNAGLRKLKRRATVRYNGWMKKAGITKLSITKDAIVEMICGTEDSKIEYQALEERRLDMLEIKLNCESLADSWKSRGFLLKAQSVVLNATIQIKLGKG